jgi:hypothetical protein
MPESLDGRLAREERYFPIQLSPAGEVTVPIDEWARAFIPLRFDEAYVMDVIQKKHRIADLAELQSLCCTDSFSEARVEAILATLFDLKLIARRQIIMRSDWLLSWIEPARSVPSGDNR